MPLCLCVCLSVPKDLANRWTDQVHLNRLASHRSREGLKGLKLFLGRVQPPSQEKSPLEKFPPLKNNEFCND